MKEFVGFIVVTIITICGLWVAQHETPRQEMLTAIALIILSAVVIVIGLKTISSES